MEIYDEERIDESSIAAVIYKLLSNCMFMKTLSYLEADEITSFLLIFKVLLIRKKTKPFKPPKIF